MGHADVRTWLEPQQAAVESLLRDLVEINTYTANETGVDQGMALMSAHAADAGLIVEPINTRHRLIKTGKSGNTPRVLLISHMDTVFPPDGDFLHYEPLGDGFLRGPGVGDIKGGVVMGLWAMRAIREFCPDYDVQMIVSADEETGSPTIRDWYLANHAQADYGIGLEPGFPQGALTPTVPLGVVYQRRGYGAFSFTVNGKSAHSGTPQLGLSATEAMAQRIIKLHALNDPALNVNVNVGMVRGGISPNTVPGSVDAAVSFRFERLIDGETTRDAIQAIIEESCVCNPQIDLWDSATYTLDAFIPPMERTERSQIIVDIVLDEAKRLNHPVVPIARGGGSDANFVSAAGTPSICGMGAPTADIHTPQETIYLPMLHERIDLLAGTLMQLTTRKR
ncbi:MAG: M20/M25/M40 family metallo-hydrolase [Chloroflexota bacterium]|nr:M20/M25/M40 family metallo-hydrolase [Chloroflexota bacterium]